MNPVFSIISIAAIVTIMIFATMRNNQAKRNDKRRERLEKRNGELKDRSSRKILTTEKDDNDESGI